MRHALIVAFFGRLRDRFCEYGSPLRIDEKLARAAAVQGVEGAEIVYPDECSEPELVADALSATGLAVSAVNVNLKSLPEFQRGALSSGDAQVRRKALDLILGAKEFAARIRAERVTCAPLADGVDYSFQHNYSSAWRRTVELLRTGLDEGPSLPIHLEHKPGDPRTRGFLRSSDVLLRLLNDVARSAAGITFNVGHASVSGTSPAEYLSHVLRLKIPLYVHFCDAAGEWDWDLLAGSQHIWAFCEVICALQAAGYEGWLTDDTFPVRADPHELFSANIHRVSLITRSAMLGVTNFESFRTPFPMASTCLPLC
jgi:xylose isomerase